MSVIQQIDPPLASRAIPVPRRRSPKEPAPVKWTVEEFHLLCNQGHFEDQKVCLLAGEIIEMPFPNPPHDLAVSTLNRTFSRVCPDDCHVRVQQGLVLSLTTDPMPDVAIVNGAPRDYEMKHPTTALLAIEISDTTRKYDLGIKVELYAAGGVPEYWVLDIPNRKLIVHRDPVSAAGVSRYRSVEEIGDGGTVSPAFLPSPRMDVSGILPASVAASAARL